MPFIVATIAAVTGYLAPAAGLSALGFGAAGMLYLCVFFEFIMLN